MKIQTILLAATFLFMLSCTTASNEGIDEKTTQTVLDHHWETFVNNDLEGVMEDYTEESVLITPDVTYRGLKEIRQNFIRVFKSFPVDGGKLTLNKSIVVQDVGYILWEADVPEFKLLYATDSFIIRNGKIIRQTFAGVVEPK
ncbi:MAG TPA: nuclear transport factor 2 family protein [Cyclobacteriaceae bacterium]|nr:nuclear transport factor 2 family protein [Cyclobacteriaceae bacterium]